MKLIYVIYTCLYNMYIYIISMSIICMWICRYEYAVCHNSPQDWSQTSEASKLSFSKAAAFVWRLKPRRSGSAGPLPLVFCWLSKPNMLNPINHPQCHQKRAVLKLPKEANKRLHNEEIRCIAPSFGEHLTLESNHNQPMRESNHN